MKKRVLSLFMALALCFSMLPTAALAEEVGAAPDAANADSTYTTGEDAGLAGGEDDSAPDDTDGGDTDSSGEAHDGEADTAVSAVQGASHASHCVCGGNGDVNGHTHNTGTEWTATDDLPGTAGSYYLTQSVSGGWTVPEGKVNLCLNGQTIDGSIKVGSGATLTLTDCTDSGRVQGEVTVNGGTFELYGGTITGGVQVGIKGGSYQTGSNFTMYGGTISGHNASSGSGGGVFLVGTTNQTDPPSFTMHGGTISNNTAGASDGGGGGVYVGEKCSFTMDGGTITGNTATAGNGGGIYIHFNAGNVSISNATITGNKASATGNTSYGHGGGIYSERGVTVENVTITGNNSTFEGGGIYGKGAITLTDATVTDNSQYDVYYGGKESSAPKLTVSGSVKAGYYANYAWKLPILVSGELSEDSVIRVGVYEGIKPNAGGSLLIAEPADGVTLSAENFEADAAGYVTSLGEDGNVYLVPCTHEMDDTGYTCKKCKTQFDARVGDSAYYQTLTKAFDAARGNNVTLLRDVTLTGNCSATDFKTLDLNGKTVSTKNKYIGVGGGNKPNTLTVKDSGTGGGTQPLTVKFLVYSNGTLAVDDSYTGDISRVELQAGGALERFGGKIGELVLSNAAYGSTSTGYGLKLWKGNTNACTIGKFTDNNKSKSLTVKDLLGTDYAKCELYGEKGDTWSIVPKTEKISGLTGYTAYKVQFPECVHQCADDSNPVCSVCHKNLYTKITAQSTDGTTKTAYFTEDSALENGYVEAIQTLNGWSNEGCTEPTLTLLRDMYAFGTSMPLTGTLTLEGGTHTAKNVTVAEGADVTFASGSYKGATINGTATVKEGVTFTDSTVTVNGTLNVEGGTFTGNVKFNGSSIANISGGSFTNDKSYEGVEFDYSVTGTISGGTFAFAWFYTTKVKLSGGTFTTIKTNGDRKLADLLAEGAAYYRTVDDQAVTDDRVGSLENVKVVSHTHNGGKDDNGTCSICGKQMAASLTVGGKTSWYAAFATAIEAANAADGEKTITLYQDVNGYADGNSTTYELTRGPVTLATGGKKVTRVVLIAKGISLTVTGSDGGFYVTVDGKDAELTVNDKDTKLAIVTAQNGGKLSLSNGTFSRVDVMNDGSSASLSGGSYGEITSGNDYVKPYALLAKGYAYKKTKDNQWLPNANSIPSEVTVEKAPFAVEKIYPNSDTNYTENSAFATDGKITLTAVIAPETQGVTYTYWWELFNESENDWTTQFSKVNAATHDGKQSKTLTISGLPVDKSYQYHIFVQCSNGYNCYSEPFTVTRHEHSWTYTASGATITAKCSKCSASGGSVTIAPPAELTYSGEGKPATVTASSDWQGPAAREITISYIKADPYIQQLENGALPTNAGTYTASITLGEGENAKTASVEYTIEKATLTVTPNSGQRKKFGDADPTLTYAYSGEVSGEIPAFDGALSRAKGEDVGQYDITKGSLALEGSDTFKATNYNLVLDTAVVTFEITKGTYGGSAPTKTVNILKNYAGVQTGTLTAADFFTTAPAEAKITNAVPNAASSNMMSIAGADSSGNFTYDSKTNITAASDESWTVTISSKNYTDITGTLTFKLVDKTDVSAQITFPNGTLTYNGAGQKYEKATISTTAAGTPAWTYTYAPADATASLDGGLPKTAGTYTVTAVYEDDAHIGTKNATLTVSKATPTGAPTCTKITTSGKTLADAPLAIGTIAPAGGTLAWDMAANTVVAANTAYGWTYTPADTANYKALTGSLTPYAVSTGGGGGGSSAATPSVSDKAAKELKNAKEGSTVAIDMKGETKLPASVTKEIAGKDVTVELDMGGGMVWSFNGLDVPKGGVSLDLGVKTGTKTIPAKVINALTGETTTIQLQLNHNGPFGMSLKLSVDLGKKHDGLYANLYFYNPKSSALEFQSAGMISGGRASWVFDHASDYAIVIDKESHEPMTFTDVPDTAYYAEAVNWAVTKKITGGVGNDLFAPNAPCTRAQIVTFLWRAAGSPGPKTMSGFSDVPADSYYAKAVAWAVENGITGGTGDGKFSPDATCTRAQAVTFLYRASGAPAVSGNAAFSDVATNAYYAAAVKWAEKNGITGGIGGGLFGSDNNCTRAQIVTFLYRNYQSK